MHLFKQVSTTQEFGGKPTKVDLGPPCPYCGGTLRTNLAKQCQHCFKSWHD